MAKKKNGFKLFNFFSSFFSGVKGETKKITWTSKNNLVKFSVATLVFMVFICLFFVAIDTLIVLIEKVKGLVG